MSDWHSDPFSQNILAPEILVPKLGNYLVEKDIIDEDDLKRALSQQQKQFEEGQNLLLGQILIDMGLVDKKTLDRIITEQIIQLRTALQNANEQLERRVQERTSELEKALEKLAELDRMKSNFISNISHELRTPLTHIKGYLDLLIIGDLGKLDEDQMSAIKVMSRSSSRLEQLIDELIMFSSVEHGKLDLNFQKVDLIHICQECIQISRQLITDEGKNIQLLFNKPDVDSLMVQADRNNISWVIQQFIENARKFTSNDGQILLEVIPQGDMVHVAIEDTGIGIPYNRIDEIFEPFHQLDSDSTRKYSGTGLGLTLVKNIVSAHGSQISVTSEPGKGSRFVFSLKILA